MNFGLCVYLASIKGSRAFALVAVVVFQEKTSAPSVGAKGVENYNDGLCCELRQPRVISVFMVARLIKNN